MRKLALPSLAVVLLAISAHAAELKKPTAAAYDRYIAATETRLRTELQNGTFLFIDAYPEKSRAEAYTQLRNGQILVQQVNTKEEGHPIEIPHGLIHDWAGVLFIPNTTLSQTLAVIQDYDHHQDIYKPEVRRSKLLSHDGDRFKVFLQLYKKSLVTVAINAEFENTFEHLSPTRATMHSYSTRLAEVSNPGQTPEREYPVDAGNGFLWRLYSYWRFEEKDGGVYVQLESIGLSRGVPVIFAWMVNPLLRSIPRGTLTSLLASTRVAVTKHETGSNAALQPLQ